MRKELLSDSNSSSSDSEASDGGASIPSAAEAETPAFKVNEAFALEEKHGTASRKRKYDGEDENESDSTSESEDEGELATEALDSEIIATINAIRSKDPRVYDVEAKFYTALDEDEVGVKAKKEKPMRLQDYHRENLLKGVSGGDEEDEKPMTYNQEQEHLKRSIVGEINAAAAKDPSSDGGEDSDSDTEDKGFLVAKERPKPHHTNRSVVLDVENADQDPETFLSNFMSSRAWVAPVDRILQPFDSDDSEDETRAEAFEQAYNLRFEDPARANETLRSHARDMAAKYSVRRDEINPRQKKREEEKIRRKEAKWVANEEKTRLKKLRVEKLEEKVKEIKRAAGLRGKDIGEEDWGRFVDEDWDDERWEVEMKQRFGEDYYAEEDLGSGDEGKKKKKVRKPKFDGDIDIKDIVPDFEVEEKPDFSMSDEDEPNSKKKHKMVKDEKRKEAKRERRIIEQLVEDQLQLELNKSLPGARNASFRYRETSPKNFGLTARDILLAEDSQLNEFAGLKKLAAFRDPDKKQKDQKHLGKRARLRKWRKETFGSEEGLQASELIPANVKMEDGDVDGKADGVNIVTKGKKKRRRSKKAKVEAVGA